LLIPRTSSGSILTPAALLGRAPLFDGLDASALNTISLSMELRTFEPGEHLCEAGERAERLLVIADGLVNVVASGAGREERVLARQRRPDVVGATSLITGEPQPSAVVAATPTTALELGRGELSALLVRFPAIQANLNRILTRRLAQAYARQAEAGHGRGEAVALVAGRSLLHAVPGVLSAARAASAGSVQELFSEPSLTRALLGIDDLLMEHGTVVVVAGAHEDGLSTLLEQVDRAVVLASEPAEVGLVARAAERARHTLELVASAEAAEAAAATGLRVLRRVSLGEGADGRPGLGEGDVAWLGRHVSRTKLGLALGAGGAKGYAHIGALQALEEAGYVIDCVAGSSIGAIVGAWLALGMDAAEIEATLRDSFDEDAVAEAFKLNLSGKSSGLGLMERIFRETTGERSFHDVLIPLTVMSVDLVGQEPAPLRDGPLWQALLAATALAGMFPPYEQAGRRLVDGLALVPVPTGALVEGGADVTLSVNLMSRDTLPAWPGEQPPPEPPARRGSRMLDTLLEVMDLANLDNSIRHAGLADVVVTPRFGPGSWRDFHLADQFMRAGREAAEAQLPALAALARPQSTHVTN
jgi:NTE family protein